MYTRNLKSGNVIVGFETHERDGVNGKVQYLTKKGYEMAGKKEFNCAGFHFTELILVRAQQNRQATRP